MELISDQDFVVKWLKKDNYDENEVADMLIHQLDCFNKRRKVINFHSWLFNYSQSVNLSLELVYLPNKFKSYYGQVIIRLPAQQVFKIWEIFLQSEIKSNAIGLELFPWFLDHVRIADESLPGILQPKEDELIETTAKIVAESGIDNLADLGYLNKLLQLAFSWGNLKFLKYSYENQPLTSKWKNLRWDNLAPIHSYYDGSIWKDVVSKCMDSECPPYLSKTILQLLIQKVSVLIKASFNENDEETQIVCRKNSDKVVTHILSIIQTQPHLLQFTDLRRLTSAIPDDHISQLTDILIDSLLLQTNSIQPELSSLIMELSERPIFIQSIVDSVIRYYKKFLPQTSPLINLYDQLLSLSLDWNSSTLNENSKLSYTKICQEIHDLVPDKANFPKNQAGQLALQIFDYIPMGYLQPDIQLKSTLFLSSLLFSIEPTKKFEKLLKLTTQQLTIILKGVRFFWLFEVTSPVDYVDKIIIHLKTKETNLDYFTDLVTAIFDKGFKDNRFTIKSIKSLTKISMELAENPSLQIFVETIILKEINAHILKNKKIVSKISDDSKFWTISTKLVNSLIGMLDSFDFPSNQANSTLMTILDHKNKNPKFIEDTNQLKKICKQLIKNSYSCLADRSNADQDQLRSHIHLLTYLCSHFEAEQELLPSKFLKLVWTSIFINYPEISQEMEVDGPVKLNENTELVVSLSLLSREVFRLISGSKFTDYVDYTIKLLESQQKVNKSPIIHVLKGLFSKDWATDCSKNYVDYEDKKEHFNNTALDKILHNLTSIIMNQSQEESTNVQLIQSTLDLIKCILHNGKTFMTSPRIYLCLQTCVFVPLKKLITMPCQLAATLTSLFSVVNELLLQYEFTLSSCMVVIKDIVQNYLSIIIQASAQEQFINYELEAQSAIETCASDLNRLITLLANLKDSFAPYSPQLIICYITLNHQYTIHPVIKRHLILCVYRLLIVIKSNPNWMSIYEMVHCRLDDSGREILKILYENYEKYYVFKGRF